MTTNYVSTFIAVSPDCPVDAGSEPKPGTIAAEHLRLLRAAPYTFTSDELLFAVHAERAGLSKAERAEAWPEFTAKPRACLRASPLVKQHGWGIHHDGGSRLAAFGVETEDYRRFARDASLKQTRGMRSKRG